MVNKNIISPTTTLTGVTTTAPTVRSPEERQADIIAYRRQREAASNSARGSWIDRQSSNTSVAPQLGVIPGMVQNTTLPSVPQLPSTHIFGTPPPAVPNIMAGITDIVLPG